MILPRTGDVTHCVPRQHYILTPLALQPLLLYNSHMAEDNTDALKPLTGKQELFCQEFIKDLNAVQAAVRAGYLPQHAKKNAYTFLRHAGISARISELKADSMKRTKIEADDILRRLIRIAERTEQEGDYNAAIRSLELLGKHQALWTDKNITEITNAFATGNSDEDIQRDVERLQKIAAPKLKIVKGK